MGGAVSIAALRLRARRRLPRMFFDYLDGGSFSEATLRRNEGDFDRFRLHQAVLCDVSRRSLATEVLGHRLALPIMLGPVGFGGMFWRGGEAAAASAAAAAGVTFCLSTFSVAPLSALGGGEHLQFQGYVFRDRALSDLLMQRAWDGGVRTLFLTVDTAMSGLRERDVRNGFRLADRLSARAMADIAMHPAWALGMLGQGMPVLGNLAALPGAPRGLMRQAAHFTAQLDPSLVWADIAAVRRSWSGRLVLKGIMSAEDARRAVQAGADGIVVSNHGGRQLDGGRSSILALAEIAPTVGHETAVLFDGGVRRGADVVKALALGAHAVLLGRAYAFGLAAGGEAGVAAAIAILAREIDITLALMGVADLAGLRDAGRINKEAA